MGRGEGGSCAVFEVRGGGALYASSGKVFVGCNVENASYGLTICAERAAVFAAVAAGELRFEVLAIASAGGAAPCGACRQVLAEVAPGLEIVLIDTNDLEKFTQINLAELLPHAFRLESES